MELYYEDFVPGQQFKSREGYTLDRESIIAFAKEFDPQPQHIDEEGAKNSVFGTLVASGWHTAAATMRLKAQTELINVAGGLVGMGIEKARWPRPVLPGETLHAVITVLDMRLLQSKPGKGVVCYKVETFNQDEALVMEMKTAVIVPCRAPA